MSLIIFFLSFSFLAWRYLPYMVAFTIFLLPLYQVRFPVFGVPTNLLEGMVVVLLVVWGVARLPPLRLRGGEGALRIRAAHNSPQPSLTLREGGLLWPITLFLMAATISAIISPNKFQAWIDWRVYFVEPILFFFMIRDLVREEKNRQLFLLAAAGLLGWVGVLTIMQKFTGFLVPPYWESIGRMTGPYSYPNAVGLLVSALAPFVAVMGFRIRDSGFRILCLLGAMGGVVAVVLAQSKGAMLGLAASAIVAWFYFIIKSPTSPPPLLKREETSNDFSPLPSRGEIKRGVGRKFWLVPSFIFFIALLVVNFKLQITDYLFSPVTPHIFGQEQNVGESLGIRKIIWSETWPMLKDHWFLGAGLAGYKLAMVPYHQADYTEIFMYPHNFLLNIWSELGLLGLLAVGWLVIVILNLSRHHLINPSKAGSRQRRRFQDPQKQKELDLPSGKAGPGSGPGMTRRGSNLVVLVVLASITAHGLVDVPYFKNDLALALWLVLAFVV